MYPKIRVAASFYNTAKIKVQCVRCCIIGSLTESKHMIGLTNTIQIMLYLLHKEIIELARRLNP